MNVMKIFGIRSDGGLKNFDSFEDVDNYATIHEFLYIIAGMPNDNVAVLSVNTDFLAYARSREQEWLDKLEKMQAFDQLSRSGWFS